MASSAVPSHDFASDASSGREDMHVPMRHMERMRKAGVRVQSNVGLCKMGQWGFHLRQKWSRKLRELEGLKNLSHSMSAAERMSLVALFDLDRTLLRKLSQISFITGKSGSLSQSTMKVISEFLSRL